MGSQESRKRFDGHALDLTGELSQIIFVEKRALTPKHLLPARWKLNLWNEHDELNMTSYKLKIDGGSNK